jgi:hypothetical protein
LFVSKRDRDLTARPFPVVDAARWQDPPQVLGELYQHVQARAIETSDWYLTGRRGKKMASRTLRVLAVLLASAGGLVPLANVTAGQAASGWGYILLAGAGVCFGLDRFLGLSAGWMRYMLTAQRVQRRLSVFQFDWTALEAATAAASAVDPGPYLELLRTFSIDLSDIVLGETGEWVADFQSGLTALEAQTGRK